MAASDAPRVRRLPAPSLESLYPPIMGHDYFHGHRQQAFVAAAGLAHAGNRWWLAEHALLSYTDATEVRSTLAPWYPQLTTVAHAASSGFAYLAVAADHAVLALRGTEVFKPGDPWRKLRAVIADWISDAAVARVNWDGPGKVHRGFRGAFEALWPGLVPAVDVLPPQLPLYCCGHSLGGALALLATQRLQQWPSRRDAPLHCLSAGQPRVGDGDFKAALSTLDIVRLVNGRDLVARLPPGWTGYRHVGRKLALDATASTAGQEAVDRELDQVAPSRLSLWLGAMTPAALVDHSPLHYALRAWNAALEPVADSH